MWGSHRINNINQHFVAAFLGVALKQQPSQDYLALAPLAADNTVKPEAKVWKGFRKRTAVGLSWGHLDARGMC